jgi:hypothetical protein
MGYEEILFDSWVPTFQKHLLLVSTSSNVQPEYLGSSFFQYIGTCLSNYMASCPILTPALITIYSKNKKLRGFSLQANYADRAIATRQRS